MEPIEKRIRSAEILWFTALGTFQLVACFAQSDGANSALCKRNA